jgi:hypothetical protein
MSRDDVKKKKGRRIDDSKVEKRKYPLFILFLLNNKGFSKQPANYPLLLISTTSGSQKRPVANKDDPVRQPVVYAALGKPIALQAMPLLPWWQVICEVAGLW